MPEGHMATPSGLFSPSSITCTNSGRHPVGLAVLGDLVDIPSRYYGDPLGPSEVSTTLSARQWTVLACMFTRHHNGFVRQRWARQLTPTAEPWVVPFVLQLLGEYVIEIIVDLQRGLEELDDPCSAAATVYREVLLENPGFLQLTRQRVGSYWDCYYKGQYLDPKHYPAHQLLLRFEGLTRRVTR